MVHWGRHAARVQRVRPAFGRKGFLRWMGLRPKGSKVLRFDSHYVAEGCGGGFEHACGVRVQKVQRVQRVQRVVVSPLDTPAA